MDEHRHDPFLQQHGGANDALLPLADDDDATMATGARRAALALPAQQQRTTGREALKPTRTATLSHSIGWLPPLTGFAQIVGLALEASQFQRRCTRNRSCLPSAIL